MLEERETLCWPPGSRESYHISSASLGMHFDHFQHVVSFLAPVDAVFALASAGGPARPYVFVLPLSLPSVAVPVGVFRFLLSVFLPQPPVCGRVGKALLSGAVLLALLICFLVPLVGAAGTFATVLSLLQRLCIQ